MGDKIMKRSDKVAFYEVDGVFTRMRGFTEVSTSKNPIEYSRKYVDEESNRNDVVGYDTSISYQFDVFQEDAVHQDIVAITDHEKTGDEAVRRILVVDMGTKEAVCRSYAVIADSEGGEENAYTYSGTFKANGAPTFGTATVEADGLTATFAAQQD